MTDESRNWYALYVKSRFEFVTRNELSKKGIDNYLPSIRKLSQWSDRKKPVEFPLFPGYCFVHVHPEPEEFLNVLRTRGAVTLLSAKPGLPTPVPYEEIRSLRILIGSGNKLDVYPNLKEGARVRVRRGPLSGAEGILKKKENACSLLVNIELLGRSVGVTVYADDVEAV